MSERLGDVLPRLNLEEGKDYLIEANTGAWVDKRESDFEPVYSIRVLRNGDPVLLMGGQGLIDELVPLLNKNGDMTSHRISKALIEDPESGEKSVTWEVVRAD